MTDSALGSLSPRGTRRIIYNSDPSNTIGHLSEAGATEEELRQVVRNYAEKGAFDTVVQEICHQGWTQFWRTDLCGYDARPNHQRLVPLMDTGVMPVEVYIDESHRQGIEFIAGFRMNDRHGHNPDWFEKLGREKPEWILKGYRPSAKSGTEPRSFELGCALDYSVDAVRDFLFSIMEEAANRFDIDGLEFNYTRLPACFPRGTAEANHATMTDFVRRTRRMLDEAGENKGRRLILGARVLQHLDSCLKMGFDVPTWIGEGLIDYVAPGDIGITDFNAQFDEFVQLARESDCCVYPQIQKVLGFDHRHLPQHPEHSRAAVMNIYGAGADGYSTQNYFDVEAYDTLKEMRDPDLIARADRHYIYYPIWGPNRGSQAGYQGDFPYSTEEITLDRNAPDDRGEFRFRLCEHLPSESEVCGAEVESGAMLTCRPRIVPGDELAIDINGQPVPTGEIFYEWNTDRSPEVRFPLGSPPTVYGDNRLGMRLAKSAPGARADVVLYEVEVFVRGSG